VCFFTDISRLIPNKENQDITVADLGLFHKKWLGFIRPLKFVMSAIEFERSVIAKQAKIRY